MLYECSAYFIPHFFLLVSFTHLVHYALEMLNAMQCNKTTMPNIIFIFTTTYDRWIWMPKCVHANDQRQKKMWKTASIRAFLSFYESMPIYVHTFFIALVCWPHHRISRRKKRRVVWRHASLCMSAHKTDNERRRVNVFSVVFEEEEENPGYTSHKASSHTVYFQNHKPNFNNDILHLRETHRQ